ncbi:MAG: 16S rRNA (cytosine(1402)-N(4))-methyltransferase, partial [Sphaerospermopsis sp.]|nr:16S rRNA (cytosine(1402)-N(4))-methyltransferase [Sphaerospermopsis sp.]
KHGLRNSELLRVLTKKPIIATEEEIKNNPRSRSAKLRIAERKNPAGE